MRVLLVEDDPTIAEPRQRGLARYGHDVAWVRTGRAAPAAPAADLLLLDLGLPDIDGLDVCRAVRARSDVPLIMISGRDSEIEHVVGLELGADDYVVKPFLVREPVRPGPARDTYGRVALDRRVHRAYLDGTEVRLTVGSTGPRSGKPSKHSRNRQAPSFA